MLAKLLLSFSLLVAAPSAALACLNATMVESDAGVKRIAKAERLLAAGKYDKAANQVNVRRYHFADEGQAKRVTLLLSAVSFRSGDGQASYYITQLEDLLERDKDNPVLIERLAEGYAASPKTSEKATAMLEDLAKRDLMPTAYGYRTLAALRFALSDVTGSKAALASCRTMTKRKQSCTLAVLSDTKGPSKARPQAKSRRAKSRSK